VTAKVDENVTAPEALSVVNEPAAAVFTPSSVQITTSAEVFCTSL
jgi:hypothetical protein